MTEILPQSGIIEGNKHKFPIRVYYEDTDIGGVVYYANYLKYMERARSEMLRKLGIDQAKMLDYNQADDVGFVVRKAEVDFIKSARFDDSLVIISEIIKLGGASVIIKQDITKDDDILVSGKIKIASLGNDGKPRRISADMKQKFLMVI